MRSPLDNNLIVVNTTIAAMEVNALLAIRKSIHIDPFGALTNWTKEENSTHCSTWKGVQCNQMGHVTSIELSNLRLNGTITSMIGDMMHLLYLNMSKNMLFGNIPSKLMMCKHLVVVDLSFNNFYGEFLPRHLYLFTKLN